MLILARTCAKFTSEKNDFDDFQGGSRGGPGAFLGATLFEDPLGRLFQYFHENLNIAGDQ